MTAEFSVAVHALVYLVHKNSVVSSGELAENICTNPARVRKVMAKLEKADLVGATKGQGSGYFAQENAAKITLDIILAALDEKAVAMNWRTGDMDKDCLISSGMGEKIDSICEKLNDDCIKELKKITIGSINDDIFKGGSK